MDPSQPRREPALQTPWSQTQPPELWENKLLVFTPPNLWCFCYAALED